MANLVHALLHCDAILCYGYGECAYMHEMLSEPALKYAACLRTCKLCMTSDFYTVLWCFEFFQVVRGMASIEKNKKQLNCELCLS